MTQQTIEKLQIRSLDSKFLVLNPPKGYLDRTLEFDRETSGDNYDFIQVFGTSMLELDGLCKKSLPFLRKGGLFWVSYPKKTSKAFSSDCSRDKLWKLVKGYRPVRQIAIDKDWTAMRFKEIL